MVPVSLSQSVQTARSMANGVGLPTPIANEWRRELPLLRGRHVQLREIRGSDAAVLLAMLTPREVARFISAPPTTVEGFERFTEWANQERAAGRSVCYAVVPLGSDGVIGVFQVRQLDPEFRTAEWGFALGAPFWGTGVFMDAARLTVEFAFEAVGAHRLEARASVANGRGNGALAKLGAVREAVLRESFLRDGIYHDQALWSILRTDWRQAKAVWGSIIH
jgi:RimJ/RimL family protein N-acetyltransferase